MLDEKRHQHLPIRARNVLVEKVVFIGLHRHVKDEVCDVHSCANHIDTLYLQFKFLLCLQRFLAEGDGFLIYLDDAADDQSGCVSVCSYATFVEGLSEDWVVKVLVIVNLKHALDELGLVNLIDSEVRIRLNGVRVQLGNCLLKNLLFLRRTQAFLLVPLHSHFLLMVYRFYVGVVFCFNDVLPVLVLLLLLEIGSAFVAAVIRVTSHVVKQAFFLFDRADDVVAPVMMVLLLPYHADHIITFDVSKSDLVVLARLNRLETTLIFFEESDVFLKHKAKLPDFSVGIFHDLLVLSKDLLVLKLHICCTLDLGLV